MNKTVTGNTHSTYRNISTKNSITARLAAPTYNTAPHVRMSPSFQRRRNREIELTHLTHQSDDAALDRLHVLHPIVVEITLWQQRRGITQT